VSPWLLSVDNVSHSILELSADTNATQNVTDVSSTCLVSQHFDGSSFIGGMVLAFGVVAILCFMRLFFRAQDEERYHTL